MLINFIGGIYQNSLKKSRLVSKPAFEGLRPNLLYYKFLKFNTIFYSFRISAIMLNRVDIKKEYSYTIDRYVISK